MALTLFPLRCARCQKISKEPICPGCFPHLPYLKPPFCQKCALPLATSLTRPLCYACREHPRKLRLRMLRSAFLYEDPIKTLLLKWKFGRKTYLSPFFANFLVALLYHPILSFPELQNFDALVPIPVAPARLSRRWFNQAESLAEEVAHLTGLPVALLLSRKKWWTSPQSKLPFEKRKTNIRDAFLAQPQAEGKCLLLIDDVATSGHTLSEAAKALYQMKAREVYAITVCRSVRT